MLAKIDSFIGKIEASVLCFIISAISIIVFLQVLFRYVFQSPLAWTDESSRYLQVWLTFIGASLGVRYAAHFHLDVVYHVVSEEVAHYLKLGVLVAMLFFVVTLMIQGGLLLEIVQKQFSPAMNLSMKYAYGAIPVGMAFMSFHLIVKIIEHLQGKNAEENGGECK